MQGSEGLERLRRYVGRTPEAKAVDRQTVGSSANAEVRMERMAGANAEVRMEHMAGADAECA
ncbi:hypothetical protein B0T36_18080 [Nocardia donostiensis]|nr:hypothetical protein B0T36_18080 [Nocardia donostiensis]